MIIPDINAFHGGSSAALIRDGALVAAAEEERFRRVKHGAGFPSHAIACCMREAGVRLADVRHIALNQDGTANLLRKLASSASSPVLEPVENKREVRTAEHHISPKPSTETTTASANGETWKAEGRWGVPHHHREPGGRAWRQKTRPSSQSFETMKLLPRGGHRST